MTNNLHLQQQVEDYEETRESEILKLAESLRITKEEAAQRWEELSESSDE